MMFSSVSCGMYIIGLTYSRPLWRPRACTKTIGAPWKGPPTLPSFARNSAMVFAFHSFASFTSVTSNSCRSRSQDAAGYREPPHLGHELTKRSPQCRNITAAVELTLTQDRIQLKLLLSTHAHLIRDRSGPHPRETPG